MELAARTVDPDQGVVGWDRVGFFSVDVDPQKRPAQIARALGRARVGSVSERDVEVAIGPEGDAPDMMKRIDLLDLEYDHDRFGIELPRAGSGEARNGGHDPGLRRDLPVVGDVQLIVVGEVRVGGESGDAPLLGRCVVRHANQGGEV